MNPIENMHVDNDAGNTMFFIPDKRTYTVSEIQEILSISRPTAYELVKKGHFRVIRVGGHIRISKKSFDEWLDSQI